MHDSLHQQRFTHLLNQISERLDELLLNARRFAPLHIPLEIMDEIAITIGELTLVLSDHLAVQHTQALAHKMISHAEKLRRALRSGELSQEQLAEAIGTLTEHLHRIIVEDKRAA
jgi:predicted DNA-binding protein (UPF0251 family)